ncbi:PH domain-containing protein [Streptomyces sp. NPDC086080]|uniref:PH domain-containing protein n=1 Tax=Streptomyces sp. NPDC086080 TaxID=3365748 RepID=UPI0037D432A8
MTEAWIALDAAEKRKNWRAVAYFTAICVGVALAVVISERGASLWWMVSISFAWLISIVYIISRSYGRALLTPEGISFSGLLSRGRSIPWSDVIDIEKRHHTARSNQWWDLRLVRANGRPLTVPGAFTSNGYDPKFEAKYALLCQYWRRATS